jgi:hypothetical protein
MISPILVNKSFLFSENNAVDLTPGEVRAFLIEKGVLPTCEEAKATFWSMGDNWWRQIIDGKHQKHGCMVFDLGLHGGHIEPGYLGGVKNGSHYFLDNFHKGFSINLYKETHHISCAHFSKKEGNGIICDQYEIDHFRTTYERCSGGQVGLPDFATLSKKLKLVEGVSFTFGFAMDAFSRTEEDDLERAAFNKKYFPDDIIKDAETKKKELDEAIDKVKSVMLAQFGETYPEIKPEEIDGMLRKKKIEILNSLNEIGAKTIQELNEYFIQAAERLGLEKPFIRCFLASDRTVAIEYDKADFEIITEKLISEFNVNLESLQKIAYGKIQSGASTEDVKREYQESVIPLIAQIYADLEWAHPWIDGQGRTDLIMLNGLLCFEGLTPCILFEPYFSTSNTISLWVAYLKTGLVGFKGIKEHFAEEKESQIL